MIQPELFSDLEPAPIIGMTGKVRFDGETYEEPRDKKRILGTLQRVFVLMQDGHWRTLEEISRHIISPPASVSARLRDFRKPRFGSHEVERRVRGEASCGLWEYRLIVNKS